MKKELTPYTLEENKNITTIFKDGVRDGCGVLGVVSALEAIFVLEGFTKKDWLIYEDGKVYLVDREEHKISQEHEELQND